MKELSAYKEAMKQLPSDIREAEVNADKQDILSAQMCDGKITSLSLSDQTTLFVRVTGESTGFVSTEDLEEDAGEVMAAALENSRYLKAGKIERLHTPDSLTRQIQEEEVRHTELDKVKESLLFVTEQLKSWFPDLTNIIVGAEERVHTAGVVNSNGCDQTYSRKVAELTISACEKGEEQNFFLLESASDIELDRIDIEWIRKKLNLWKANKIPDIECKAGSCKAVLDGSVLANMFITAWKLFSGQSYITNSTIYSGRIGSKIASDTVTLMDLPVIEGCGYEYPFDCEGSAGMEAVLVENGILRGLMHNLETSKALGVKSTGNAGRTSSLVKGTDITITPKNFCLKPGEKSLDELLAELGDGLYIYQSYDVYHSINSGSGDYTIPCNAILVKDGKRMGKIDGMTMNGNISEFFQGILSVGRELSYKPLDLHKSYMAAAPSVLVSSVTVSGS